MWECGNRTAISKGLVVGELLDDLVERGIDFSVPMLYVLDGSAPVTYELYYGAFKSRYTDRNLGLLDRIAFEVVPFDAADARAAGAVRANLEAIGRPIGPLDTLIAGQALARGLVLVTANTQEFARVEGFNCEDWSLSGEGHP